MNMLAFPIPKGADPKDHKKVMKSWRGLFDSIDTNRMVGTHTLTEDYGISGAGVYSIVNHLPYIFGVQSKRDPSNPQQCFVVLLN